MAYAVSTALLIGLFIVVLTSCKLPAPSCYLLAIDAPQANGVQLFERTISELKASLNLAPHRYDRQLWTGAHYSLPNRIEVGLFLHKRIGKMFLQFTQWDQEQNNFSEDAAKAFEEFYVALGRSVSPSHIQKSCRWRDVEDIFGDDVYSR